MHIKILKSLVESKQHLSISSPKFEAQLHLSRLLGLK